MKKTFFLLPIFAMLAMAQLSAQTQTVSGHVYKAFSGQPIPGWSVYVNGLDPTQPGAVATTDPTGFYSMEVNPWPSGSTEVMVWTTDACTQVTQAQTVPLVNGAAVADFYLCNDSIITNQNCWTTATFQNQGLSFNFAGQGFSVDPQSAFVYNWDFGDGTTATGQNVAHNYANVGYYYVTLTTSAVSEVPSAGCISYSYLQVYANGPTDSITVSGIVTNSVTGDPIPFTWVSATSAADPNGASSGYTDANGYYSFVTVVPQGSPVVEVLTLDYCIGLPVFNLVPIVNYQATADFQVCSQGGSNECWVWSDFQQNGLSFDFVGQGSGIDSSITFTYAWDFGDGSTGTGQSINHVYANEGSYKVIVIATSSTGCVSESFISVYAYEPYNGPVDTILVSGVVLSNDSVPHPIVYAWVGVNNINPIFPGGQYYGITDSSGYYSFVAVVPAGDSTVIVQTFDNCFQLEVVQTVVIVNGQAVANFQVCDFDFPPIPGCSSYITYTAIDSLTYVFKPQIWSNDPTAMTTYGWDFGDGTTSTEQNPTHTYAQDGIYTVSLHTADGNGCIGYACEVVATVGGGIIDTFWYGCQAMFFVAAEASNPATPPLTYQFSDASFGAMSEWAWHFGDGGSSMEQNPLHTYTAEGLYTVTLHTMTLDGCESEISMEIWVGTQIWNEWNCQAMFLPLPDSSSTGFYFLDLSSAPGPITGWFWDFGDGTTSTEQNPYHEFGQPGIYTVSLTIVSLDSCSSVISFEFDTDNPLDFRPGGSNLPVLGLAAGVSATQETPAFEALKLFPNPATTEVRIAFDSPFATEYTVNVLDLSGKTLTTVNRNALAGTNVVNINVADLKPGLYMVQLTSNKGTKTVKFSKF